MKFTEYLSRLKESRQEVVINTNGSGEARSRGPITEVEEDYLTLDVSADKDGSHLAAIPFFAISGVDVKEKK